MMRRRSVLKHCAVIAGIAAINRGGFSWPAHAETPPEPLKSVGAKCGLKIGVQAEKKPLQDPAFAALVRTNFNLLTPGNELKWPRTQPAPQTFDFTDGDWMVEFCRRNGLAVHGHNLCWNSPSGNPSWFATTLNQSNAAEHLSLHINTVMKHYAGQIESWDVVNEPVVPWSHRADGLYPGIWLGLLGPTYIDLAFHTAAGADPKALRVLNIYNVEQGTSEHEATRRKTIALLEQMLARKVPIQAIGIESHLDASAPPGGAALAGFVKQIRDMGLQVLITELDVDDSHVPGDIKQRQETVADTYGSYLNNVVPTSGTKRVIFWTPSDKWDWLDSSHDPQKQRADHTAHQTGLFDAQLSEKPAFAVVRRTFESLCAGGGK
jgi:endo-1,4-beta-xylanase